MIDLEGKPHIIRESESLQTLLEVEFVPTHLEKFEL